MHHWNWQREIGKIYLSKIMSVLQKDCQQIFVQNWNQTFCFVDGYAELENDDVWKIGL